MAKPKLTPKSQDELQAIIAEAVRAAVDHVESDIAPHREKAQLYYNGGTDLGVEEGRSKVVATKVRDTIRQIRPSLMRVFLAHEKPLEFEPVGPEDVPFSELATKYTRHTFERAGGYRLLRDAFDDAMLKKVGLLKAVHEKVARTTIHTFSGLTEEELYLIAAEDDVEILEHGEFPEISFDPTTGEQFEVMLHDLKVARTRERGEIRIYPVPPEEFFISADARDIETATVCGHRTTVTVGDLVAMGFDWDEVADLGAFAEGDQAEAEKDGRRGYVGKRSEPKGDPALKKVTLTEAYMRVDADGTGVPVLHRFLLGGVSYRMLSAEPWDDAPFADFTIDPIPHSFWANSIFDLVKQEQDASSGVLRGILDNVNLVNNPRLAALEGQVNLDDLLNNEIGAVVRERIQGAVRDLSIPFVAGQTLPALQYLDAMVEEKTGVTKASTGLDPDALQSTTRAAVSATISAAAGQVEVMARNLAEGGMARLFKLLLKLLVKHADRAELVRLNGEFVEIDPRDWNADMDVTANIGLGTGKEEEKAGALTNLLGWQMGVVQAYGIQNPLVSLTNIRNTVADLAALGGLRNSERYVQPMDPTREQQIQAEAQAAAENAPPASDPNAAILQAEQLKAQLKAQTDMAKLQQQGQLDQARLGMEAQRMMMADDRERDRMAQDLALATADMGVKYGVQLDVSRLQATQAAPRDQAGNAMGAA